MQRQNKTLLRTAAIVLLLICLAVYLRFKGNAGTLLKLTGLTRSFIYIGLFGAWGVSVWRRIVQKQVRRYLLVVSVLIVFWMAMRTAKYFLVMDPSGDRLIWYAYYIPMLFIPLMSLFVALSLGKAENDHLPKWTAILYVPTTILVLLVLINDFHQLVFTFPPGAGVWTDEAYAYNICYWFVIGWEVLCAVTALAIMLFKCRIPKSRKALWLPFVPFLLSLLYGIMYVAGVPWLMTIAGDITALQCLLYSAIFESCIQCGLIQSNTGYDLLFPVSTISAQITDKDYNVVYSSVSELPKPVLRQTEAGTVALDRNTLFKGCSIRAGFVVWQEDVTELADTMDELRENQEQIKHANDVERENYNTRRLISQLREKNRLYDLLQEQTAKQNALLSSILDTYYQADDEEKRKKLLAKAAVFGAYIKRKGNLVFLREQNEFLPAAELSFCLNESMQNLELMGVKCELTLTLEGMIAAAAVSRIYDMFQAVVEAALERLAGIWVHVSERAGDVVAHIEVVCSADLSTLELCGVMAVHEDDGTWSLTLRLPKGGEVE
ncbi:MAG: histidine kinase N-terminal 7TM domain-containing protein [bacterium]|nr:histidine kinase N-terminal 7TM domain-containing protein [bacterium]